MTGGTGPRELLREAMALQRSGRVSEAAAAYERLLARGKAKMAALGAAMRKLVHLCFGVFKTRQPYQADYAPQA